MNTLYETILTGALMLLLAYQIHSNNEVVKMMTASQNQAVQAMNDMNNKLHMTFIRS